MKEQEFKRVLAEEVASLFDQKRSSLDIDSSQLSCVRYGTGITTS
jgi:hypothetical protein